jgi:uncharacterized protein
MGRIRSSARAGRLILAVFVAALCSGCERRIDEPLPAARRLDPASHQVAELPKRCVRESPKVPRRPASPSPDPRCPKDPEKTPSQLRLGKVTFTEPRGETVAVEIPDSDHDVERGLMYRTRMPPDHGMLFVFGEKSNHAFWMHNTCISLDLLFIDSDGLIVGIEESTPTLSDDALEVGCGSKYVLELNAGWARAHGVSAGQKVNLDGI